MRGAYTHARNTKRVTRERGIGISPVVSHLIPLSDRNYLAFAHKSITSTTVYHRGFRLLYQCSRHRFGSSLVGPINATLKHLKLATVTPGAASILSTYFASSFPCRFLGAFSSSMAHAAINLWTPSHTVLYQTSGSSAAVSRVPRDTKHSMIIYHANRPLSLLSSRSTFSCVLQLSRHDPLG